jgi:hypothetical protein
MKYLECKRIAILFLLLMCVLLVSCFPAATNEPDQQEFTPSPTFTETVQPAQIITPTLCPPATPEPLWVDPVISPTDQLAQVITVYIGNGDEVTIATESGTFTVTGAFNHYTNPVIIEISLLPDIVHHLKVIARVKSGLRGFNDCTYGGYTLTTTNDKNGVPLTIAHGPANP